MFRFRKSKSLFPGARLNIGKRSGSIRLGGKGFGLTIGTAGTRASAGIPGTGLSFSTKLGGERRIKTVYASPKEKLVTWALTGLAFFALLIWIGKRDEPQPVSQPATQIEPARQLSAEPTVTVRPLIKPADATVTATRPQPGKDDPLAERWQAWHARCQPEQVNGQWRFTEANCVETRPR